MARPAIQNEIALSENVFNASDPRFISKAKASKLDLLLSRYYNQNVSFGPQNFLHIQMDSVSDEENDFDEFYEGDLTAPSVEPPQHIENGLTPRLRSKNMTVSANQSHCTNGFATNINMNTPIRSNFRANELENVQNKSMHLPHSNEFSSENPSTAVAAQEKRKLTRRYCVTVFSICYAILLIVLTAIVFIGDVVITQYPFPQVLCIFMLLVAFSFFLFLYINIRWHVSQARDAARVRCKHQQTIEDYLRQANDFDEIDNRKKFDFDYKFMAQKLCLPPVKELLHKYCFVNGRHGGSLYLKFGAAWFTFGLLTHSILQIGYQILFLTTQGNSLYQCASYLSLTVDIIFPIYSLFTLFFIVKYMDVVINAHQNLARFCLMHAIGTSLSFWVFTIVRETADAIARSDAEKYERSRSEEPNDTVTFVYNDCGKSNALNVVHRQFAPYLCPFIIEYCILVVGIWYKIYRNINSCPRKAPILKKNLIRENEPPCDDGIEFKSSRYVYADCHSSFRGMFAGLFHLILTLVSIILMFIGVQNDSYLEVIVLMTAIFELAIMAIMIVTTALAYTRTIKLDIIPYKNFTPKLDDVLLFIAIPAFAMEFIFSLVPAIHYGSIFRACICTGRIIQVFIQTPFIIDGMRRCANEPQLRKKKPGRELVIFLTIANMSIWVFNTFSVKTAYDGDERYAFYGFTLWNILNHVSTPLIMFYRFHSSVCLVDIWNYAYEPATGVELQLLEVKRQVRHCVAVNHSQRIWISLRNIRR